MTIRNTTAAALLRRRMNALKLGTGAMALAVASAWAVPAMAQETTSSMNGSVQTSAGQPAAGTTLEIVHTPSGTRSNATVNAEGRFQASNLRVGGPYTITLTPPGGTAETLEGIFVRLGEPYVLNYTVGDAQEAIQEIVISGERIASVAIGSATQFNEQQIDNAVTISRDLKDVIRNDPKVFIDAANSDAIQIAGTNNRFNSLTVDGVKQNDDFGLNNGGYPTQRSPISLDAIDGLSVLTAPYDVEYSGFQGGSINVVTKSGTNSFSGSAFYYYGDQDLSGDRSGSRRNLISDYEEETYGGSLGGPIIQDTLFFFVNYEKFKSSAPVTFAPQDGGFGNPISGVTVADVTNIRSIAQSVYGYDTLGFASGDLPEEDEKILAKIDWNVTDDHRISAAYQRNEGNNVIDATSSTNQRLFSLQSNFYDRTQILDSYSLQLFSDWTPEFSTEIKVARKEVESLREPLNGRTIGEFRVRTPGGGEVVFGPDISSHSNYLTTKTDSLKVKGEYLLGDHTLTAGYERDEYDYFNLFLQRSLGQFDFASIADFQARRANRFRYNNAFTNAPDDAAAEWAYATNSFYVQDTWNALDNLTLQIGLRYEQYVSDDDPIANALFQQRYGFSNNESLDGRDLWLPRFGFTYDATDTTTIRGGAGLFSGLGPAVWLSNNYSNDGFTQRSVDVSRTATSSAADLLLLNNVTGQITDAARARLAGGDGFVNALDPDFKLPSSWKFSVAVDQEFDLGALGDQYFVTAEAIYTKVKDAPFYRDLRLVRTGTAPDGRPIYAPAVQPNATGTGNRAVGSDLLLTNTDEGESLVLSIYGNKTWDTDYGTFDLGLGYSYQDVTDAGPGTSSVASSNYEQYATLDPNTATATTSIYETKHRFAGTGTYSVEYFNGFKTSFSLFGESRSGKPYSFVYGCSNTANPFGDPACRANRNRQLAYIPTGANDPLVNWAASTVTPAQFDAYINRNGLDNYRGRVAPRNAFESSWVTTLDAKLTQEIPAFFEGHRAEFSFDIKNLTNLLNSKWGRYEQVPFFHAVNMVNATIDPSGRYVFATPLREPEQEVRNRASVWKLQVGVRYEF